MLSRRLKPTTFLLFSHWLLFLFALWTQHRYYSIQLEHCHASVSRADPVAGRAADCPSGPPPPPPQQPCDTAQSTVQHARPFAEQTSSYFCGGDFVAEWDRGRNNENIPWAANGGEFRGQTDDPQWKQWMLDSHFFCGALLHDNLEPWTPAQRYSTDDVAVGLFSGENLFFTSSLASRETWLRRFAHHAIFASFPYEPLGVVGLADKYRFQGRFDGKPRDWVQFYNNNIQLVQLFGLKELYHMYPDRQWYQVLGTDNYLHPEYTVKMLDTLDASQDHWLVHSFWPDGGGLPDGFDADQWPRWTPDIHPKDGRRTFHWASGAVGWFLSRSVMRAFADNLDRFMSDPAVPHGCHCPDRLTGMLLSLLGFNATVLSDWQSAIAPGSVNGVHAATARSAPEFLLYHYVPPVQMLSIDERVRHEQLDRLANRQEPQLLMDWTRHFVDLHFRSMRAMFLAVKHALHDFRGDVHALPEQRLYDLDEFNSTHV